MLSTTTISQPPGSPQALYRMLLSQAHDKECALREMVQNGIEANLLFAQQCFDANSHED